MPRVERAALRRARKYVVGFVPSNKSFVLRMTLGIPDDAPVAPGTPASRQQARAGFPSPGGI
jgi:hypothetical protein